MTPTWHDWSMVAWTPPPGLPRAPDGRAASPLTESAACSSLVIAAILATYAVFCAMRSAFTASNSVCTFKLTAALFVLKSAMKVLRVFVMAAKLAVCVARICIDTPGAGLAPLDYYPRLRRAPSDYYRGVWRP